MCVVEWLYAVCMMHGNEPVVCMPVRVCGAWYIQVPLEETRAAAISGQQQPAPAAASSAPPRFPGSGTNLNFTSPSSPVPLLFTGRGQEAARQLTERMLPRDAGTIGVQLIQVRGPTGRGRVMLPGKRVLLQTRSCSTGHM